MRNSLQAANNNNIVPTGIYDQDGNPYLKTTGAGPSSSNARFGGAGGGGGMREKITLEQNVRGLNIWIGFLTVAFGAAFLFFLVRIDDRFDKVDGPLGTLQSSVAAQTETLKAVNEKLGDVKVRMDRVDDAKSKGSARGR